MFQDLTESLPVRSVPIQELISNISKEHNTISESMQTTALSVIRSLARSSSLGFCA